MREEIFNPFEMAQTQFDKVAETLELDMATHDLLRNPLREYHFSIPVRMDEGQIHIFRGFRVQHNDSRGPCKGGIRFHPEETIDTLRAQAMWSTWKCAILDIPLGGGNGGVICDPHNLSPDEMEQICRGYVRRLGNDIGALIDVPAPDIMASPQHMLWMLDEYEAILGQKQPGFITGKPVRMGGSLGRREATGYGLVYTLREALEDLGLNPKETTASVQGFGNVGQHAVELYQQIGGTVTCVCCWDQSEQKAITYKKKDGIDFQELLKITDRFGGIDKNKANELDYEILPGEAWIEQDVDILIPAALENQITSGNVARISEKVKIIAEGADGPTTPDADKSIAERNIYLIPDLLANAGGAVCSYFEQVQSNMNFYWTRDEVLAKLDVKMTAAFIAVSNLANSRNIYMRDAAYLIGVSRVAQACRDRGWV